MKHKKTLNVLWVITFSVFFSIMLNCGKVENREKTGQSKTSTSLHSSQLPFIETSVTRDKDYLYVQFSFKGSTHSKLEKTQLFWSWGGPVAALSEHQNKSSLILEFNHKAIPYLTMIQADLRVESSSGYQILKAKASDTQIVNTEQYMSHQHPPKLDLRFHPPHKVTLNWGQSHSEWHYLLVKVTESEASPEFTPTNGLSYFKGEHPGGVILVNGDLQELDISQENTYEKHTYRLYAYDKLKQYTQASELTVSGICLDQNSKKSGDHCYLHSHQGQLNFSEAELLCSKAGGHLVSINSEEESHWLHKSFEMRGTWNGLNDLAVTGVLVWSNGEPFKYPIKVDKQSDEASKCTYIEQQNLWSKSLCSEHRSYLCEAIVGT